ncbi:diguanylate cyclase, GGDEF domain-containing protein [Ditylenchus destructor]|nr:diguanylate cyclase, GGDEF domain-containing protein [Ditylenchus destructor]
MYWATRYGRDDLFHRATHDDMTGLANRSLFMDRLRHATAEVERGDPPIAVVLLDMDGLKRMNDTMGHAAGDAAIIEFSRRLAAAHARVRHRGPAGRRRVRRAADPQRLREPWRRRWTAFTSPSRALQLRRSGADAAREHGRGTGPEDWRDATALVECADSRMYESKRARQGAERDFVDVRAAHNGRSTRNAKGGSDDGHGVRGRVAGDRRRRSRTRAGPVGGHGRRRRPGGAPGHAAGDGGLRIRRPQAAVPQRLQRQRSPGHPRDRQDIALILLDVVMESEHAGLDVARFIREELGNTQVRIVLRTGQPGQAPEEHVIKTYDINDYKEKTELTKRKLITVFYSALRSYRDIVMLSRSRQALRRSIDAITRIHDSSNLGNFASALLEQVARMLGHEGRGCARAACRPSGLACRRAAARPGGDLGVPGPAARRRRRRPARRAASRTAASSATYRTHSGNESLLYMVLSDPIDDEGRELLDIFCANVAIAYEGLLERDHGAMSV